MIQLHQLLHGYRSGHQQIASSVKLNERNSDLVTRLSDLSGSLSSGIKFSSYLTVYPLPEKDFFAVARTWPDAEALRSGCVLTHTLLVPIGAWAELKNVRSLDILFRNPRVEPDYDFAKPIALPSQLSAGTEAERRVNLAGARKFVSSYFGQALKPIVWFEADQPEEYLWRLLEHLWPRIRAAFSCCTFSLQQRSLEQGPFDLLFAPSSISPRFLKLPQDQLIKGDNAEKSGEPAEPWLQYWAEALFSSRGGLPSGEEKLPVWNELSDDPTTLRKLSLIQELSSRASHSPTAGVGAIDVVESLANDPETALPLKRQVIGSAIAAAEAAIPAQDVLTSLRLIDDRLRRESFKRIASEFKAPLNVAAARATIENPESAITADETWLADSRAGSQSAYVNGVVDGLRHLANKEPLRLSALRSRPDIAAEIFRLEPRFARTYLEIGGETAPAVLGGWLSTTRDSNTVQLVRKSVLPILPQTDDGSLLSLLLRDLRESEVKATLDTLAETSDGFANLGTRRVAAKQIASAYPLLVRKWGAEIRAWTKHIASITAATYGPTKFGFEEALGSSQFSPERHAVVVAVMVNGFRSGGTPYWFRELVSKDVRTINILFEQRPGHSDVVDSAIESILTEVGDAPFAKSAVALAVLSSASTGPNWPRLIPAAVKSVLTTYVSEGFDTPVTSDFMASPAALGFLQRMPGAQLIDWFVQSCSDPSAAARAWQWLSVAPRTFYERQSSVLPNLCEALLRYSRYTFPFGAGDSLVQILRRSRAETNAEIRQQLAATMLRFAFDNVRFPLGGVVAEAFSDVYEVAVQESGSLSFFSFFGSGWDKGKDFRIGLIDAFLGSDWRPGDLALAADNAGILRKIFKRLRRRSRGNDYIRAMANDLASRNDPSLSQLNEYLQSLISSPTFYEEWD